MNGDLSWSGTTSDWGTRRCPSTCTTHTARDLRRRGGNARGAFPLALGCQPCSKSEEGPSEGAGALRESIPEHRLPRRVRTVSRLGGSRLHTTNFALAPESFTGGHRREALGSLAWRDPPWGCSRAGQSMQGIEGRVAGLVSWIATQTCHVYKLRESRLKPDLPRFESSNGVQTGEETTVD